MFKDLEGGRGWGKGAKKSNRIDVGVCYTRVVLALGCGACGGEGGGVWGGSGGGRGSRGWGKGFQEVQVSYTIKYSCNKCVHQGRINELVSTLYFRLYNVSRVEGRCVIHAQNSQGCDSHRNRLTKIAPCQEQSSCLSSMMW